MYNILEQAIIDAKALREAALKNAETAVLERYSDEVKSAIDVMLEAEVGPVEEAVIVTPEEEVAEPALAAAEGEELYSALVDHLSTKPDVSPISIPGLSFINS